MITKEEAEKAYQQLIIDRQKNPPTKTKLGEVEIHHILPTSCGGLDVSENKISLYAKEHFMAHVYLWIIHHDDKFHYQVTYALNMMINGTLNGSRRELRDFILASEEYQKAKEECAQFISETISPKITGEKNGMFGKSVYHDPITFTTGVFINGKQPEGWIKGNIYKDKQSFKNKVSANSKDTIWIRKKDQSQQKHIKKDLAIKFIKTGDWEIGHLQYTKEQRIQQRLRTLETQFKNGTRTQMPGERKRYPICLNCGKNNPNKFARCCSDECKNEYDKKIANESLNQKHLFEASVLEKRGYFDCQTTELYRGVINRKQVRRYFEITGRCSCDKCGKSDVKLIIHAIDGNCRNLSIDNYEFLCKDCYTSLNTSKFQEKHENDK